MESLAAEVIKQFSDMLRTHIPNPINYIFWFYGSNMISFLLMISDFKFSKNKLLKDICQKTTRTTYLGTLRMMQAALMSTAQK